MIRVPQISFSREKAGQRLRCPAHCSVDIACPTGIGRWGVGGI